jgi:hypothetical protein
MKTRLVMSAIALNILSLTCHAGSNNDSMTNLFSSNRIAIQGAIATGGSLGIGLVNYTEKTELGLTVSGKINNSSMQTKTITPVIFAGLRKSLSQLTYFAYGIDLGSTFGRDHGVNIESSYQIGPYISIEQMLTYHVMLAGWIQPYAYQYEKKGGTSTSTNNFFNTGGIAINYLF